MPRLLEGAKVGVRPAIAAGHQRITSMTAQSAPITLSPEVPGEHPHVARVGVKDTGHNVTTVCGEAVDGRIADLADGDT